MPLPSSQVAVPHCLMLLYVCVCVCVCACVSWWSCSRFWATAPQHPWMGKESGHGCRHTFSERPQEAKLAVPEDLSGRPQNTRRPSIGLPAVNCPHERGRDGSESERGREDLHDRLNTCTRLHSTHSYPNAPNQDGGRSRHATTALAIFFLRRMSACTRPAHTKCFLYSQALDRIETLQARTPTVSRTISSGSKRTRVPVAAALD